MRRLPSKLLLPAADELRVGTAFADVVPTSVPEPSAVSLLCGGVAMFLSRRRRLGSGGEDRRPTMVLSAVVR